MPVPEIVMKDGSAMHTPCTCPECAPGPGIDYTGERLEAMLGQLEKSRTESENRHREWQDKGHRKQITKGRT